MKILTSANLWYGQLRGYNRRRLAARVDAALSRTAEQIRHQQLLEFRSIVCSSLQRFPAYAEKVRTHLGGSLRPDEPFLPGDLPLWDKHDQRQLFARLNPADFRSCFLHASGGSTGVPIQFYMTRHSYEWRTAVARRSYSLASAEPGQRVVYIWGDSATIPPLRKRIRTRLSQWAENRHEFNCFFFDDDRKKLCCEMINRIRPTALVGYAGKLAELAVFCRDHPHLLSWRTPNIVTAAEGLQPGQRESLREHLGDHVLMSYGSREFMSIGMESRHGGGYHLADDNLLVEVVDDNGQPVLPGESGRIVVTDLHNTANPFIRYVIGDRGIMSDDEASCPAGLPFRRLLQVHGRQQEFIVTPQGDRLTLLYFMHHLKEFPWIDGFQIVQRAADHIVIRVMCAGSLTAEMVTQVRRQLRPKLRSTQIDIRQVDELTRRSNGKIAVLISEIPESQPLDRQNAA